MAEGFLVEAAKAIRGLQCQILAANEYILGAIPKGPTIIPNLSVPFFNAQRRLLGCDPDDDIQPQPPPFEGGQCDFQYNFNVVGEGPTGITGDGQCSGSQSSSTPGSAWGPISNFRRGEQVCSGGPGGGAARYLITAFGPGGAPRLSSPVTVDVGGPLYSATLQNVVPSNPMNSDNCGDPDPIFPPPTNINFDVDVTFQPDFGPEITVPINVDFSPFIIDFSGNVSFPFNFNLGGFEFSGNLSFDPEVNVNIDAPINFPRGTGQPTDELPPQDDPDPVDPAPPEEIIIGVAVQSAIQGEQQFTTIATQGMPPIFAPRAGSIKFAYSIGAATFWSNDIDVKGPNVFVPCPFARGADAVVVTPAPGVELTWRPVFGSALATVADLGRVAQE